MIPQSLYIHIPWCVRKCPYCDFNSHALRGEVNESRYIDHLLKDLAFDLDNRPIESIFIGGGTPSLFSGRAIGQLLAGINSLSPLPKDCEITLEANPGTFEQEKFFDYRVAGVNRLSIGIQSFDGEKLACLGRIHNADEAKKAVKMAKKVGFSRINLDLMFALPKQTIADACQDLQQALDFNPEHISWYQLTLEPNTAFYLNPPPLPDSDAQIEIFEAGAKLLEENGFQQYEISAWTQGSPCRHNLNYWQYGDYLGIGAGAHSKQTREGKIIRASKYRAPKAYENACGQRKNPYCSECFQVIKEEQPFEIMMNALRLKNGIKTEFLAQRTNLVLEDLRPTLNNLRYKGLIENNIDQRLKTTPKGFAFLNDVIEAFL